jgi:hypothetical protein
MLSPDDVFIECNNCGSNDADNDVEIDVPDRKTKDFVSTIVYYCDECYNKRFEVE